MTKNTGNIDRIVRVVLGVILVVLGIGINSIIPPVIGAVLLVTAAMGFCPLYRVFGFSTCPVEQS